jgi:pre-mRNA-processing factor 6
MSPFAWPLLGSGATVVDRIAQKMMVSLAQYDVVVQREQWLREAQQCEAAGALLTCAALVRNALLVGVEEEDRLATWLDGAPNLIVSFIFI